MRNTGLKKRKFLKQLRELKKNKHNHYLNECLQQWRGLSTAWRLPCSNDALIFQIIFGDKMFMPHTFFDQFLGTEVCSRELMDRLCSNALFIMCGFDRKNLNVVCMLCGLHYSRHSSQTLLIVFSSSPQNCAHSIVVESREVTSYCSFQFQLLFPFKTWLTFG